jgi:hypothetical protein
MYCDTITDHRMHSIPEMVKCWLQPTPTQVLNRPPRGTVVAAPRYRRTRSRLRAGEAITGADASTEHGDNVHAELVVNALG